tara:strand:- start:26 stop:319 length:294 start_codon:yes stop_codon:yes gene_type:complete
MFSRVRYARLAFRLLRVTTQIGSYYNRYGFRRFDAARHLLAFAMISEPSAFAAWLLIVSVESSQQFTGFANLPFDKLGLEIKPSHCLFDRRKLFLRR